jgi:hypothetical protein
MHWMDLGGLNVDIPIYVAWFACIFRIYVWFACIICMYIWFACVFDYFLFACVFASYLHAFIVFKFDLRLCLYSSLHVSMCIHLHTRMYACTWYIYIYIYIYIYACVCNIYLHICIYSAVTFTYPKHPKRAYTHIDMRMYTLCVPTSTCDHNHHTRAYTHISMCTYTYVYQQLHTTRTMLHKADCRVQARHVCMCVCIYVYIYILCVSTCFPHSVLCMWLVHACIHRHIYIHEYLRANRIMPHKASLPPS